MDAFDTIWGFRSLQPGWDGADAMRPPYVTILRALDVIRALPGGLPAPAVSVTLQGAIALEWGDRPNGPWGWFTVKRTTCTGCVRQVDGRALYDATRIGPTPPHAERFGAALRRAFIEARVAEVVHE